MLQPNFDFWESRWTRHKTQIQFIISLAFSGDITDEGKVLDWLISNRATGDEAERLEEVTLSALEGMTSSKDGIAVLFCEWYLVSKKKFLPFSFSSWQLTTSLDSQIHFVPLFATFWVNLIRWTMYFLAKQKRTMIFRIFLFFIFLLLTSAAILLATEQDHVDSLDQWAVTFRIWKANQIFA